MPQRRPRGSGGKVGGGGSGNALGALLMQYFGSNVDINPDAVDANILASGGVLEGKPGQTMISADRYKALTAPGVTDFAKANNWLSRPTANQLNQQFGLNRALGEAGVNDALTQAKGMVPINLEQKAGEVAIQKDLEKFLTTEQGQRWFLSYLGGIGLDANNPETVAAYNKATVDPIITQKAAEAAAAGEQATLAGQEAARTRSSRLQLNPELMLKDKNDAMIAAQSSGFQLDNLVKTLNAQQRGIEQAPDIAAANAAKNLFQNFAPGSIGVNTGTGEYFDVPAKVGFNENAFVNGGAALTNNPARPPMQMKTIQPGVGGSRLILKGDTLYDMQGRPVRKALPSELGIGQ